MHCVGEAAAAAAAFANTSFSVFVQGPIIHAHGSQADDDSLNYSIRLIIVIVITLII